MCPILRFSAIPELTDFFFASKITVQFAYKANNVLGSGKQIEFVASRSALEEMLNVVVPMERK